MYDIAVAIVFLLALLIGFVLSRTVRQYRDLGISERQPACGQCRYSMRGWNSPKCPECGSDVRQVGVITGSRWTRPLARGLVVCLALLFAAASIRSAIGPRTIEFAKVERSWRSSTAGWLQASLDWTENWDPSGKSTGGVARLSISRTTEASDAVLSERSVPWPSPSTQPTNEAITATIREVAGEAFDEAALELHADEMSAALFAILSSARAGTPPVAVPMTIWQLRDARSTIMPRPSIMLTASWLVPLVLIVVGFSVVALLCRPWKRRVRDEELPASAA